MNSPPSVSPNAADMLAQQIRHLAEAQHAGNERLARMETRLVKLLLSQGLDAQGNPQDKPLVATESAH